MKKILILSSAYFPYVGGAEISVKEISDRIKDFEFDMLTARMDRKLAKFEKIGNINVFRIGFGYHSLDKYIYTFFGFFKAARMHLKNRYDIFWPIMAAYSSFSVLLKIFFPKTKVFLTLQEGDPVEYIMGLRRFRIFKPIYGIYFRRVDYVQTISRFLAQWAYELGVGKERIEVVPNGVDIKNFQFLDSNFQLDELKGKLGVKAGDKVIITVSRLVQKNAVGDIIDALKYLPSNVKLLVAGVGPLSQILKQKAEISRAESRVLFLGHVGHRELPKYLKISDIFVRPSLSEGLGNVFLEAMAAGIPVIGTNVGGIPDFLKDKKTGLFCEVKNPENIAEKVRLILEDGELRQKIVKNAKKMVEENYDWDLIAIKMKNIFNKLTAVPEL